MNRSSSAKRAQIVQHLVEGCSINSTVRLTGTAKNTVLKLLTDLGPACQAYQDKALRNLSCRNIQVDEIWSFCRMKDMNVPEYRLDDPNVGSVWTWVSLDRESKLVPCWLVGRRTEVHARQFLTDLAGRLANRIQLTSDGHEAYHNAVRDSFGKEIDYAMLIKTFALKQGCKTRESYVESKIKGIQGNPLRSRISTAHIERANLTIRMNMRRLTRKTNGFSKKLHNLKCAMALNFMHYNFVRIHGTLKTTPAVAAGVTEKKWTLLDLIGLIG